MSYQAVRYNLSLSRVLRQKMAPSTRRWRALSSLRYESLGEPVWSHDPHSVELEPLLSGICGSDLGVILGTSSPYLAPLSRFPAVLGHEVVGRVTKDSDDWAKGTPVVINPALSCGSLALKDPCLACRDGHAERCYNRGRHELGMSIGFHTNFPGGFSQRMWAPSHQLYAIPPEMPLERAVLAEPLSIVLHALSHVDWSRVHRVLVIGAGPIGLLTLFALGSQGLPPDLVMAVARYPQQQRWAKRFGAEVVSELNAPAVTEITGVRYPSLWHAIPWRSKGFDLIIDAAGSKASLEGASGCVNPGGQVLLLGAAGEVHWDFTPMWSRDMTLYGSYGYGNADQIFPQAIALLDQAAIPIERLVTHTFYLDEYKEAFQTVWDKRQGPLKVCLKAR